LPQGKNNVGFISYVLSRVKRLLFPLWCFLTLFFLLVYLFGAQNILNINLSKIFYSYAMLGGIGYVWVIRIFLMIAILSPLYVGVSKHLNDGRVIFCSYAVILISSLLVVWVKEYTHGVVFFTFTEVIIPAISYGVLFIIGCRFNNFSINHKVIFFMLGVLSIVLIEIFSMYSYGELLFPQQYKYPPSYLYVFYAFALIPVFYLLSNCLVSKFERNVRAKAILVFISSNTIWIYFLHIPVVEFFRISHVLDEYYIKWVLAFLIPCLLYTLQYKLIALLAIKIKNKSTAQILKRTFTG
jgi:fucose 4-O-acetylase-like acetyltransferase